MGLAYTLSKSEGIQGYDWLTEELYGEQGLRDHYYGPPTVTTAQLTNITGITRADRRHMLVLHYSYEIPTLDLPIAQVHVQRLGGVGRDARSRRDTRSIRSAARRLVA